MAWEPKHVKKRGRGRSRKRKNMAQGINGKTRLQELGDANTQQHTTKIFKSGISITHAIQNKNAQSKK